MAGGPAYILALRNALEGRASEFQEPPRTGGKQQSIRLDDHLAQHVDVISKMTGWNRTEIFSTLIQRGLFDLYEMTDQKTAENMLQTLELSLHEAVLWLESKNRIQEILVHFSRRNGDIDDWECLHLSEAIQEFRFGRVKYARAIANIALTPIEQRSQDPAYTKNVPKKNKTLDDLKNEFEQSI